MTPSKDIATGFFSKAVIGTLVVGTLFSFALFSLFHREEQAQLNDQTQRLVEHHVEALDRKVNRYNDFLNGFRLLFSAYDDITYAEFVEATHIAQTEYVGLDALEWAPFLTPADLPELRRQLESQGLPALPLQTRADEGSLVQLSNPNDTIQPVVYIEPFAPNQRAYGFDILGGFNRPAVERARLENTPVMSRVTRLFSESSPEGFALYFPVRRSTPDGEEFRGTIIGLFQLEKFVGELADAVVDGAADITIEDITPNDSEGHLATLHAQGGITLSPSPNNLAGDSSLARTVEYSPWQRQWRLTIIPTQTWTARHSSLTSWFVLLFAMACTVAMAGMIGQRERHLRDIEVRVAMRTRELTASQSQFRSVIEHSSNSIFLKSIDRRYLVVNQQFCKVNGLTEKELIGRSDDEVFASAINAKFRDTDLRVLNEGNAINFEDHRTIDGRKYVFFVSKFPIFAEDGSVTAIGGVAVDVTERVEIEARERAAERELLKNQRLESIASISAGIAHQFNNLLAIILSNTEMMAQQRAIRAPLGTQNPQSEITHAVERASRLCRQMLAYSGLAPMNPQSIAINEFIQSNLVILRSKSQASQPPKLTLKDALPKIIADEPSLQLCLSSLLANAAEAVRESHGKVEIHTRLVDANVESFQSAFDSPDLPAGQYVEIAVIDDGPGIPTEVQAKIFDPFVSSKFTGRGLGLAAAFGVIKRSRAAVFIESSPGMGTTFRILWPVAPESVPPFQPNSRPVAGLSDSAKGLRALVVDDERSIRIMTCSALKRLGISTVEAEDGEEGLQRFVNSPDSIDFVITDLTMPKLDGDDMLLEMRATCPGLPAMMISGYSLRDVRKRFEIDHCTRFLGKPFKIADFYAELSEIVSALRLAEKPRDPR